MKKLKNIRDVKLLDRGEQKKINGGLMHCDEKHFCFPGWTCVNNACIRFNEP